MAIKSTLFLIALVLLATRMASSWEEMDIEIEAPIYGPTEDPVDAPARAPAKSPIASPPKLSAYPPIPSTQDCVQMCIKHCPKKPKKPCMKNCIVCCRDNHCVPEVTPNCKWEKAMFKGKEIKCV